jgi:hypothetical protein
MHVLGVAIMADYKRSLEDLLYELVAKSTVPGLLAVGYHLPVYSGSGLVPLPPVLTNNIIDA